MRLIIVLLGTLPLMACSPSDLITPAQNTDSYRIAPAPTSQRASDGTLMTEGRHRLCEIWETGERMHTRFPVEQQQQCQEVGYSPPPDNAPFWEEQKESERHVVYDKDGEEWSLGRCESDLRMAIPVDRSRQAHEMRNECVERYLELGGPPDVADELRAQQGYMCDLPGCEYAYWTMTRTHGLVYMQCGVFDVRRTCRSY